MTVASQAFRLPDSNAAIVKPSKRLELLALSSIDPVLIQMDIQHARNDAYSQIDLIVTSAALSGSVALKIDSLHSHAPERATQFSRLVDAYSFGVVLSGRKNLKLRWWPHHCHQLRLKCIHSMSRRDIDTATHSANRIGLFRGLHLLARKEVSASRLALTS